MSKKPMTDVDVLESSPVTRRLLRKEQLILDVTSALCEQMDSLGLTKAEVAERLGRTPGFVSHLLAGDRNLTLKTIAELADALEGRIKVRFVPAAAAGGTVIHWPEPEAVWPKYEAAEKGAEGPAGGELAA